MSGIDPIVTRVLSQAGQKLLGRVTKARKQRELRLVAQTLVSNRVAEGLRAELDEFQAHRLNGYLYSPEFEEVALQYVLGVNLRDVPDEQLRIDIRHEIYHGLRAVALLEPQLLTTAADVVFDALAVAAESSRFEFTSLNRIAAATSAHVAAAAAANSALLRGIGDLADVHEFAQHMRAQVIAVHGHMRLPHLGISRSVPYEQLYVTPSLQAEQEGQSVPDLSTLALPGHRSVILGDPGAGKSTLAAKLAHDVAADLVPGVESRVPFLLVLREFAAAFRHQRVELAHYLEQVCRAPYNLLPPPHAVDYLLRNGRAVVVLDGLDELVAPEQRRRFVQLVDGFVNRYPLVPVVVTARRIGYSDAPLDRRIFTKGIVAEFDDEQVAQYTERWFVHDASTPVGDRARIVAAFLKESANISDLRANPLLLALLCAMYSSEHFIPTNLAQIYERCAVMLFDRWDYMRGIADAPKFTGRLRGAVQHLAWHMFLAEQSGDALPRHRIVRVLVEHLRAKGFDEDDATSTAEEFLEFCTGRAWVLTDVGATEAEPRFGFTHRTFMEYFAAEHLVRTHPTATQLWEVLRPRVLAAQWEVVAQIALQLLERNIDGEVDAALLLILDDADRAEAENARHVPAALRSFAARTLGYVHPGHDTVRLITTAALRTVLSCPLSDRYHYWGSFAKYQDMNERDDALHALMYRCSPGNQTVVRKTVSSLLSEEIEAGVETAHIAVLNLSRHLIDADPRISNLWLKTRKELRARHEKEIDTWQRATPWTSIWELQEPALVVANYGASCLYLSDYFLTGSLPSAVERLLTVPGMPENTSELCAALLTAPRPWISDNRWWQELEAQEPAFEGSYERIVQEKHWYQIRLLPRILLFLPYLETRMASHLDLPLPPQVPLFRRLATARAQRSAHSDLRNSLTSLSFPADAQGFLFAWVRGEFNLVRPPS